MQRDATFLKSILKLYEDRLGEKGSWGKISTLERRTRKREIKHFTSLWLSFLWLRSMGFDKERLEQN
jgi:hypothetical protein